MSNLNKVVVPDIGDFNNVEVIEVNVKVGDEIRKDDSIITIESSKALMEMPAPFDGIVKKVIVQVGDRVSQGDLLLLVEKKEEAKKSKEKRSQKKAEIQNAPIKQSLSEHEDSVELKAEESSIIKSNAEYPDDLSFQDKITIVPLSKINKIANKRLIMSWRTIPHVCQFVDADITELEKLRQKTDKTLSKQGIHLTYLPYIIKTIAVALKKYPKLNASLDLMEENLIYKKSINIGVAIDAKDGLVVPVIHDADDKNIIELSQLLIELRNKAEQRKFSPQDLQNGTFTITNLGKYHVGNFTPIINWPEVAILGVSEAKIRPIYEDNKIVPRLILPLSLSYDHRVVDGALAAEFISYVAEKLSAEQNIFTES